MNYTEKFYRSIIKNMINAFAYHRIITDSNNKPIDYEYLEVNGAFENFTGLRREQVMGKTIKNIVPDIEEDSINWIEFYGNVALTGRPAVIEQYSKVFKRWYLIHANSTEKGYFVAIFIDITSLKNRELDLMEKNQELEQLYEEITATEEELIQQMDELNQTSQQLTENERRLSRAQVLAHVGNWELDLKTGEMWGSEEAFNLYGLKRVTPYLPIQEVLHIIHPEDRVRRERMLKLLIENNQQYDLEFRIIRADNGEERYMHSAAELEYDAQGKPIRVLGALQDITERVWYELSLKNKNEELTSLYEEIAASEEELRQQIDEIQDNKELLDLSEERYKTLVNNSQDVIYSCDCNGISTTVNKKFCEITGMTENKIIGKKITQFFQEENIAAEWDATLSQVLLSKEPCYFEYQYMLGDSSLRYYHVILSPIFDLQKNVIGVTGTNHDITALKENEQKILFMAYRDSLTDLPNRSLFLDRLKSSIKISKKNGTKVAVAFLDLDNFKKVNDTLGHAVGDELLVDVSKKICSCIGDHVMVARLSGDEFSFLFKNIIDLNEILPLIENIKIMFEEPFDIRGNSLNITASIGISVFPDDGQSAEDLLKNADTAMYKAKELGKNGYQLYNVTMKDELIRKITIETSLRTAVNNNEFELHYQPQYEAKTRKIRGFEALIRWNNPEMGLIMPTEFIPIAEETSLIIPIGQWVIETACKICSKIIKEYNQDIIISVNISAIQLRQKDFFDKVMDTVQKSGIKASNLELEVTESIFIDNRDNSVCILKRLKGAGVRIALDDFGTGYSSFSYLKKLPINLLKIDKAFVKEIDPAKPQNALIDLIISLGHKLNIETIAEGVENQEQMDYLTKGECDNLQGYYLGKPVPEEMLYNIMSKGDYK
jgi:diguanylate cyclase (GGDEF)-like protein/PAS domain S-box-containing protein